MKKKLLCFALFCVMVFSLTGCSSSSSDAYYGGVTESTITSDSVSNGYWDTGITAGFGSSSDKNYAESAPMVPQEDYSTSDSVNSSESEVDVYESELKIIKTGSMDIETENFEETDSYISAKTTEFGGLIAERSINGRPGYRNASYTIRIPSDNFDNFFYSISGNCTVTNQRISSEDVTEQYVDLETRLETNQKKYDRLLVLLEKAETLTDIYSIQSEISDVEYEINSIMGILNSLSSRISYSTINIWVDETNNEPVVDDGTFWTAFTAALTNGWTDFSEEVGFFFIDLAYALPSLILFIIILIVVIVVLKKIAKKAKITPNKEKKSGRFKKFNKKEDMSQQIINEVTLTPPNNEEPKE